MNEQEEETRKAMFIISNACSGHKYLEKLRVVRVEDGIVGHCC